jgi:hypothetical protein
MVILKVTLFFNVHVELLYPYIYFYFFKINKIINMGVHPAFLVTKCKSHMS